MEPGRLTPATAAKRPEATMRYERISADCHIDLCQLPPDLFTSNASAALRDRMPYITDSPKGKMWVSKNGGFFGLAGGMGSAGREYVPGQIHRSDRMASTGLYEDGKKGIYRLSDPELRLKDQDRDGVQAEVLYAIRKTLWSAPGPEKTEAPMDFRVARAGFAVHITSFQMFMSMVLMGMIYGGVLERHPRITLVLGEGGIGWIPYILDRMDLEWEDQFKDLGLRMAPSEYWRRQCKATFQSDKVGMKLLDELGIDNVMWASDFPHPDGIWPDSSEYVDRELGHLPADVRRKIICENAGKLYGFMK